MILREHSKVRPKLGVSAVTFVLLFLAACARGPQYYIDVGNQYFKDKRYAEAAISYRNAIQKDASAAEAYYGLALTHIAQNEVHPAAASLVMVLRLKPDHQAAITSLGDIHLRVLLEIDRKSKSSYEKLSEIAGKLLALDPNSYDGFRFKGHLAIFDGKPAAARAFFSQADRIRPNQPQLQLALADAMLRDNLPQEAEQLSLSIIDRNKTFGTAYDFLQLHYLRQGRAAEAERVMRQKAENNPLVVDFQIQLAGFYMVAKRQADAERVIQGIQAESKRFPDAPLRIGDLYLRMGRGKDAQRHYEEGLRTDGPRAVEYKKRLVTRYWAINRKAEALKLAEEIVKADPGDDEGLRLRASLLLQEGKPENIDAVVAEYTRLGAASPNDPDIPYQLGRAYRLKGRMDEAAAQFNEAIKRNDRYIQPRLALAEINASEGRYGNALRYLDQVLAFDSTNAGVRLLRAGTLRNLKRYPDARAELARLLREAPQNLDYQVEHGLLYAAEGRLAEAEAVFGKLYESSGTDVRAAAGLVQVYSAQRNYGKALELLQREVKKDPGSESIRQALTTVAMRAGNIPLALEQLEQIAAKNPRNGATYVQIGQLEMDRGDVVRGLAALRKAVELEPRNENVLLALAAALQVAGRLEEAKAVYQRSDVLDPQNPLVLNNLAYLFAETGNDLDKALLMATTATQKQPTNRNFRDTLGMVYLKKNMVENALRIFQSLTVAEPGNATFRMHLGMGLLQKGDRPEARREFQAALRARNSPEQDKKLRELLVNTGLER